MCVCVCVCVCDALHTVGTEIMLPCVATCVAKEPKLLRTCVHVVASGEESRLSKRVMATISEYNQEGTAYSLGLWVQDAYNR